MMMNRKQMGTGALLVAALLLTLFAAAPPLARALDSSGGNADGKVITMPSFAGVAKMAGPAVVHIRVEKSVKGANMMPGFDEMFNNPFFEHFFGPQFRNERQPRRQKKFTQQGQGSGFIIDGDGHILTNNHVVEDADSITVILADKREFKAKTVGSDPQTDVALMKIEGAGNLPTLPLGDSDALEVGEWAIAIGNPFGLEQTVTVGVISAKGRSRVGINDYESFIQTDAAINPGNSGGPLINIKGQAIGINSAIFSRSGGYMGIGFAIPINMVKEIQKQLLASGKVTRGWLGVSIQDVDENLAQSFGLKKAGGVLVSDVQDGTPAAKAGLRQGDVIIKLNGAELADMADLRNRVAMLAPGSKADLTLMRDGREERLSVTIGKQPENFGQADEGGGETPGDSADQYGLELQNLTPELARQLGYEKRRGVLIAGVEEGGAAEAAGLKAGLLIEEINRRPVKNVHEAAAAMKLTADRKQVLLKVRIERGSQYVVLSARAR
ncbi:MAG: DegQ family serine endoprotease [Desulfobulbaceae bacterium]|jgi:serine protease Do|nr:DegQ family serine endoprotease [Desulfobulbaceae bacterium]